jgi:UDP-arabinose 4-epimerase
MSILITGGAGFIGSFTARLCAEAGYEVVVLDNLATGRSDQARWGWFEHADIRDVDTIVQVIRARGVTTVVHLAASAHVGESIANPAEYYSNNVSGTFALFQAMLASKVRRIVFASSCSVYGNTSSTRIGEDHAAHPASPYGESKLIMERALHRYEHAYGFQSVSLRYFNVAGADAEANLGEDPETSSRIVPRAFQAAIGRGGPFKIFGTRFESADGTAVRDYVHVRDIAMSNLLAVRHLEAERPSAVLNVGTGIGVSVNQIVNEVGNILGRTIPVRENPPRLGDPPHAVADASRAKEVLGWQPAQSSLAEIVRSAVDCYRARTEPARAAGKHAPEASSTEGGKLICSTGISASTYRLSKSS